MSMFELPCSMEELRVHINTMLDELYTVAVGWREFWAGLESSDNLKESGAKA